MNIYSFTYKDGQTDWVFALNIKEAKSFYLLETGCGDLTDTTVKAVPKSEWDKSYMLDVNAPRWDEDDPDDSEEDYCGGYKIEETFAQYAERNKDNTVSDMICTTEF